MTAVNRESGIRKRYHSGLTAFAWFVRVSSDSRNHRSHHRSPCLRLIWDDVLVYRPYYPDPGMTMHPKPHCCWFMCIACCLWKEADVNKWDSDGTQWPWSVTGNRRPDAEEQRKVHATSKPCFMLWWHDDQVTRVLACKCYLIQETETMGFKWLTANDRITTATRVMKAKMLPRVWHTCFAQAAHNGTGWQVTWSSNCSLCGVLVPSL